jgi:hypothetical protein
MRRVHRRVAEVPQGLADRGTEILERTFAAYGVTRAQDLPDEGKVYLWRELRALFAAELPSDPPASPGGWQALLERIRALRSRG